MAVRGLAPIQGALAYPAAFAAAVLVSNADLLAAALPTVVGFSLTLAGKWWLPSHRIAPIAAIVLGVVEPVDVLPWVVAGACVSIAVGSRPNPSAQPALDHVELHLARCRRRAEPATFMYLQEEDPEAVRNLLGAMRATDSLTIRRSGRLWELYGFLEGHNHVPQIVERRFAEALTSATPTVGWATFPEDGVTLEVLLRCARRRATTEGAPELATDMRSSKSQFPREAAVSTPHSSPNGAL